MALKKSENGSCTTSKKTKASKPANLNLSSLHVEYTRRLRAPRKRIACTPSPPRKRRSISKTEVFDRFIPNRLASNLSNYELEDVHPAHSESNKETPNNYFSLLRSEILHQDITNKSPTSERTLQFRSPRSLPQAWSPYAKSPIQSPKASFISKKSDETRKIASQPFRILDAPSLQDDYYLNLVDWSSQNVLGVGLDSTVFLWNACTSSVTKLCDLSTNENGNDGVTSVKWSPDGTHVAIGAQSGDLQIWDVEHKKRVRLLRGHESRVGSLGWNANDIATGSRDRTILLRDFRSNDDYVSKLVGHRQEVCGLEWSHHDGRKFASGGNDNKLILWDISKSTYVTKYSEHKAAVKAITWSPHQHGLLASGGGTADRCIRFWNTSQPTSRSIKCIDSGSQVCNLEWSKNVNEIVSTHGYSLNQIIVWKYAGMKKLATLTGHTLRVLYLSISPDGQTVVTGAGDETLRFWSIFPSKDKTGEERSSLTQSLIR